MSKKVRQIGKELFENVTRRKEGEGMERPLATTTMGLARVSKTRQAMSILGDPDARAVTSTRTQTVAAVLKKSEAELGLKGERRTMPRGRGVKQENITVSCYKPRVRGMKVHGARVAVGLATKRGSRTDHRRYREE